MSSSSPIDKVLVDGQSVVTTDITTVVRVYCKSLKVLNVFGSTSSGAADMEVAVAAVWLLADGTAQSGFDTNTFMNTPVAGENPAVFLDVEGMYAVDVVGVNNNATTKLLTVVVHGA